MNKQIFAKENPFDSLAFHVLVMSLFTQYGTAIIPYEDVARELMRWKSEKTAKARLPDLLEEGLVVVRFEFGTPTTFILAQDLAHFILANRTVTISSNRSESI